MSTPDWRASRYEGLRKAIAQQEPARDLPNRDYLAAAVPDPHQLTQRKVKVLVNADSLDRLLHARRIGPGEFHAGRAYQRLLEISLGAKSLEGAGVGRGQSDDMVVRVIERARRISSELQRVRILIGYRSEHLLRLVLIETHPSTRLPWTLEQIASMSGSAAKHRVFAISQRLVESLEDLAEHWRAVRLD